MEDLLNYEKRDQLYAVLVEKFGLVKVEENYSENYFGNFYIVLSAPEFLLRYYNDRSNLNIEITSQSDTNKWFALSFIRDFIYNPETINSEDGEKDDAKRIKALNDFVIRHFTAISDLFNKGNYVDTRQKLEELLKAQFYRNFNMKE